MEGTSAGNYETEPYLTAGTGCDRATALLLRAYHSSYAMSRSYTSPRVNEREWTSQPSRRRVRPLGVVPI